MATQPNQASSTKQPNYTNPNANPNPNPNTNLKGPVARYIFIALLQRQLHK